MEIEQTFTGVCRRELSLDAPPGVFYKIGAGACLGICKKTPHLLLGFPFFFTGTFRVRVKVKLRARARISVRVRVRVRARVRVRVRIHQVGYLKIPIYIFWKIFWGHGPPWPLWLCFQQPVIMWLFGATYSSITYKLFLFKHLGIIELFLSLTKNIK